MNNKVCPVTKGVATSLTQETFGKMCFSWQDRIKNCEPTSRHVIEYSRYLCLKCKGAKTPAELRIIKIDQMTKGVTMEKMSTGKTCQCCGRIAPKLYGNYGKDVCGQCQTVRGKIKANPQLVANMLAEFGHVIEGCQDSSEIQGALDRERLHVEQLTREVQQLKSEKEQLEGVMKVSPEAVDTVDRHAIKNLGLRMAIGLIDGSPFSYTLDDIKMLEAL